MKLIQGVTVAVWCVAGLFASERWAMAQNDSVERWFATGIVGGSSRNLGPFASLMECENGRETESERMATAAREAQRKA